MNKPIHLYCSIPDREFIFEGIPLVDARKERLKKSQTEVEKALREEIEGLEMRLREERKKGEVRGGMGKSSNVFVLGTTTSIGCDDG